MSTPESQLPAPPNNPATALFNILSVVVIQNSQTAVVESMAVALDTDLGSYEYVKRHAEAVRLMDSILVILNGDEALSESFSEYVPSWYEALVFRSDWAHAGGKTVTADALKQLRSLGTTLARSSAHQWDETSATRLDAAMDAWSAVLQDTGVPRDVADDIRARLEHLKWLSKNVGRFGYGPIRDATAGLVTSASQGMARGGPSARTKIAAAIGAVFLFLGQTHEAVDDVAGILEGANQVVYQLEQMTEPQKELPPGKRQLEASPGEDSESTTVSDESVSEGDDAA